MMNKLRKILFPFSILYDGVTSLRNFLYNKGILKSIAFDIPVICVGNLSVGGTGKTPMIEHLIRLLKSDYKLAVLSRGYKRESQGFQWVSTSDTAKKVGDEPLQFKKKFPEITVAVDADRRRGINQLKENHHVILLDDAFQHRKVKPSFSILLTPYFDLYSHDLVLPAGNLRESSRNAKRADIVVVTKCPTILSTEEKETIRKTLHHKEVYFSTIAYAETIKNIQQEESLTFFDKKSFTLVTGIANSQPLVDFLLSKKFVFEHLNFPDHHHFTKKEIDFLSEKSWILTTEKDFMRLENQITHNRLFYLPIEINIDREEDFKTEIVKAIFG